MELHREDLYRMTPIGEARLASDEEAGNVMVGYPIVFNSWTEVSGWEGNFMERIAPTAVAKTLNERGDQVKVLFNHGMDPQIGDKPLGKPKRMVVDATGLWTETPLANTSYNADMRELMNIGALAGMSFRFSVMKEDIVDEPGISDWNPKGLPERTITELKLYEYGPVTFPAYEATTVGMRGQSGFVYWQQARKGLEAASDGTSTATDKPPLGHLTPHQLVQVAQIRAQLDGVSKWIHSRNTKNVL